MRRTRRARSPFAGAIVAALLLVAARATGAAEPAGDAPSIEEMLLAIGEVPERGPSGPGAAALDPKGPAATLLRFDALIAKGDYEAAKTLAEAASGRLGGDGAKVLAAAAGLADVFLERRGAMRRAAEAKTGQTVSVYTVSGRRRGEVRSVSAAGIELVVKTIINGKVTNTSTVNIAWGELTTKERKRLAEDWDPQGPAGDVARAAFAIFEGDVKSAERSLLTAGAHPLAAHYRLRIAAIKEGEAGLAARLAWEKLETKAGAARLTPEAARGLLAQIDAYEKAHGKTRFAVSSAERIRLTRAKAESAMGPYLGLVGHWRFDDGKGRTAADSSGRKNHAKLAGTAWVPGVIGNAMQLDGSGHAVVAKPESFDLGTADYTVAAWVKTNAGGVILGKGPASSLPDAHAKSLFLAGRLFFNSGVNWLSVGPIVTDGRWHHVAASFSDADNRMRLYVDGVPEGSGILALEHDRPGDALTIGDGPRPKFVKTGFKGATDEVRIYSRVLKGDEVTALARVAGREAPETAYFPPEEVKATFVAKGSMKPYPVGHRQNHFPAYEVDDPTAPFHGKAVYFDQRTGQDVYYAVRTVRSATKATIRMAAMENLVIEVFNDIGGDVIAKSGPHQGGNHWGVFEVKFPSQRTFAIRIHNEVSHWLFIDRIFLE